MFTGLVTALGAVTAVRRTAKRLALTIASPYRGLAVGESVAVDGVCLTVVRRGGGRGGTFTVEVVAASVARTSLGEYRPGRAVNLERALRLTDRLGGHLVAGHVDGVGEVVAVEPRGDSLELDIRLPRDVAKLTVPRGSLAIDGVSMTVASLPRRGVARVAVVPHTRKVTTLGRARVGTRVHLEADMIGKLVAQLVAPYRAARRTER
jgi:riboflavin synthase